MSSKIKDNFSILLAYYIVFLTHHSTHNAENPMSSPTESVMTMFLMSLYYFGNTYEAFGRTEHETVAKVTGYTIIFFPLLLKSSLPSGLIS